MRNVFSVILWLSAYDFQPPAVLLYTHILLTHTQYQQICNDVVLNDVTQVMVTFPPWLLLIQCSITVVSGLSLHLSSPSVLNVSTKAKMLKATSLLLLGGNVSWKEVKREILKGNWAPTPPLCFLAIMGKAIFFITSSPA